MRTVLSAGVRVKGNVMFEVALLALWFGSLWLFAGEKSPLRDWSEGHQGLAVLGMFAVPLIAALLLF